MKYLNGKLVHIVKCDFCDESFSRIGGYLKRHMGSVHGIKYYKCDSCEASFSETNTLKRHITAVHEGIKPHKCDLCEASFGAIQHLRRHMKVHEQLKCNLCDQR